MKQRYYWLRNFLLKQISSQINYIVTFCEQLLLPNLALYTIGTIVTQTYLDVIKGNGRGGGGGMVKGEMIGGK